ncbi:hypothetical protein ACP275_08G184600 [Erythranthe tilingii]
MEEEELLKALKEAKPKLEKKYTVRISGCALRLAVHSVKYFNSVKLISEKSTFEKSVQILDGACGLVASKFRNCDHEIDFYEKAYQLRRALVELNELHRENYPVTQSWVNRLILERDIASLYMKDFLLRWKNVTSSSLFDCTTSNENQLNELITTPCSNSRVADDRFLDDIRGQIIELFQPILTVKPCHVAEVVSRLTDVPHTQILSYITSQMEKAMYMMGKRLVNQERVINEIFGTLGLHRDTVTRPRGLFLLLGYSGHGKTEIAKAVAEHWYCDASRLVEIDMSEYVVEESAACDLSERSKRNNQDLCLWKRLTSIVAKLPYSVILLDKIDKASSMVTKILHRISYGTTSDEDGKLVDFSKSIIFMTSCVGLVFPCKCYNRNQDLWKQFTRNPVEFFEAHDCILKEGGGGGGEGPVVDVRKVLGTDLLGYVDKTLIVERFNHLKTVMRLSLREVVRELTGERIVVQASDSALDALCARSTINCSVVSRGKAFRKSVLEHVIPQLPSAEGHNNVNVYIDTLVGTIELSFRFQSHEKGVDDWYFGLEAGTFHQFVVNLRKKVEAVSTICGLLCMSNYSGQHSAVIGPVLMHLVGRRELLTRSPFPNPPIDSAFEKKTLCNAAPDNLPTDEEKEKIINAWKILQELDSGVAKATSVIVDAVVKILDAPLESDNLPARHFLFEGLDHGAKSGLITCLNETLGDSLLTYVRLDTNSGEEVKNSLIEQVKESPCMVLLFDGVEFYDDVLYTSLLQILDKGNLVDNEGFVVDFQRTIVVLTSELGNKKRIADWFDYERGVLLNMAVNQNVKRYRTELFNRMDEMVIFDPLLPEHGRIRRITKSNLCYPMSLYTVYWRGDDPFSPIRLSNFVEM